MLKIITTASGTRYGYDSLTGRIITVRLTKDEASGISDEELTTQIVDAKIAESRPLTRVRWMFSFDEYVRQLQREIPGLVIELTDICNLNCRYCAVSGGVCADKSKQHRISEKTLFKSLDFFTEHNADSPSAHIGFYGGEALLCFPMIKKSVEYLKQNIVNKEPSFDISTNGLLLNDAVAKWLADNPTVRVTCTVNGPYHDKYRKTVGGAGSLDIITDNLLHIREKYPSVWENQIRFIANVDFDYELPELLDFYDKKLGTLPGIVTNIIWEPGSCPFSVTDTRQVNVDFTKDSPVRKYYAQTLLTVKTRKLFDATDDGIIGTCYPCRIKLFVLSDGRLSFCEKVNYKYSIGDVENGFDLQTLRSLYDGTEKLYAEKCRSCWAQRMCDICLSSLIDKDGRLMTHIPDDFCVKARKAAEKKLRLFCQMSEEAPELLNKIQMKGK